MDYNYKAVCAKIKEIAPSFSDTAVNAVAKRMVDRLQMIDHLDAQYFMYYADAKQQHRMIRTYFREYFNSKDYPVRRYR